MPRSCCVKGCTSKRGDKELSFFRFPTKFEDRLHKFLEFVRIEEEQLPSGRYVSFDEVYNHYVICGRHFEDRCIVKSVGRTRLVPTAVPTLNPPTKNGTIPEPLETHQQSQPSSVTFDLQPARKAKCNKNDLDSRALGDAKCSSQDTLEFDCNIASQTGTVSQSPGVSNALGKNIYVSLPSNGKLIHFGGSELDATEAKLYPRSYGNKLGAKNRRVIVECKESCIPQYNAQAVDVNNSSNKQVKLSSDATCGVRVIDLPISDNVDNQCVRVDDGSHTPPESPVPVSDTDSTDSVILVDMFKDESEGWSTAQVQASATKEVKATTRYDDASTTVRADAGTCIAGESDVTGATTLQLSEIPSCSTSTRSKSSTTHPAANVPVVTMLKRPDTAFAAEACKAQLETPSSSFKFNNVKPKCGLPSRLGRKSGVSKGQPLCRALLTHGNILLYKRLNEKLNKRLAEAQKTIRRLRKEKRSIMLEYKRQMKM